MGQPASDLFADDFYAWTQEQASALQLLASERRYLTIDAAHLVEDVVDLGKEQRNSVRSQPGAYEH